MRSQNEGTCGDRPALGRNWSLVGLGGVVVVVGVSVRVYMCKGACGCVLMLRPDWLRTGGVDSKCTMVDVVQ